MIVVYAGVQPDTDDGRRRLPAAAVPDMEARVRRVLARLRPSLVIGAAAAGADLIVADAAGRLGLPLRLVLPHDRATFGATSVAPHGEEWEQRYDRVLDVAEVEEGAEEPGADAGYRRHNQRLLERSRELAPAGTEAWALVIRPPAGGRPSVSDDFAARAEEQGMLVLDLDPTTAPADRLRAFVAMPYGTKFDPVTRHRIDCDVVFDHVYVPVLEDLDLEWQRADLEADSGIIHVDMIEALARAEVVVVDLATQNSNVAYELGLRHALADRMTVLTYPRIVGTRRAQLPPFDLVPIRHVRFDRSFDGLSDRQAADGVRALRRVVETIISTPAVDSPVLAWFEPGADGRLRRRADADATAVAHRTARGIAQAAIKSASVERMQDALEHVSTAALLDPDRRNLLLELGTGLLQEGAYRDARRALADAEPPTGHPLRMRWLQQSALLESWDAPAPGEDPAPRWERAERLLAEVLREADDAETCGIAGGIVKRRLTRALGQGRRELAPAYLDRMVRLYRRGFQAEPGYYAGVNLTAALRLSAQHFGIAVDLGEAREALVVSRFFAGRDRADHPDAFWPAVTLAELDLHEALLADAPGTASVVDGYRRAAALPAPSRWRGTAVEQLRLFALAGDDQALISELIRIVEP